MGLAASPEIAGPASERRRFSARQTEVLDVVELVFLREGISAVRMSNLAREAGCSLSTLYELAPSKEDLLLLVLDRMMRRIARNGWAAVEAETDPAIRARVMLTSGALDASVLGPRFLEAMSSHPPARLLFDRWIAIGRDALVALIEDAVEAGQFRPVSAPVVAESLFAVALHFTDPGFTRATAVDTREALNEAVALIFDGLRPS